MTENEFWGYDVTAARARYAQMTAAQKRRSWLEAVLLIGTLLGIPIGCNLWVDQRIEDGKQQREAQQWREKREAILSRIPNSERVP